MSETKPELPPGVDWRMGGCEMKREFAVRGAGFVFRVIDQETNTGVCFGVRLVTCHDSRCYDFAAWSSGVNFHSPGQLYDHDPEPVSDSCEITGGACFMDGSGLMGDELFRLWVETKDPDAVWAKLEATHAGWLADFTKEATDE